MKASNVFSVLPNAQKFADEDLEDRCWKLIEEQTEEAVTSDEFVTVKRSLERVVKREVLNVKEVELFKAVDRWATEQSKRQGITPDGESKRRILGEQIVTAIRFPLMPQEEFASVVIDSRILSADEVGDLVKHSNGVSTSLPFIQIPRKSFLTIGYRCQRFGAFKPPDMFQWLYAGLPDFINFSVNKPITLHGVQHFGSKGGNYTVSTEVKDTTDGSSLIKQSGSYASEKDKTFCYYGFSVTFERPVCLEENKEYKLESLIKGPKSWYGREGQTSVECQGVVFTFRTSRHRMFRTSEKGGQFPVLFWSARR